MYNPLITYKAIYTDVISHHFATSDAERAVNKRFCYNERVFNLSSSH